MREFHRILIGDLLDMGLVESGTLSGAPEPSEVVVLQERARSTFVKGLGGAILKALVKAHCGRIRAERPGPARDTTFTFPWLESPSPRRRVPPPVADRGRPLPHPRR